MKTYYIEGYAGWFVVKAKTKRLARKVGTGEFGRGQVREVREATDSEIKHYINEKGQIDEFDCYPF